MISSFLVELQRVKNFCPMVAHTKIMKVPLITWPFFVWRNFGFGSRLQNLTCIPYNSCEPSARISKRFWNVEHVAANGNKKLDAQEFADFLLERGVHEDAAAAFLSNRISGENFLSISEDDLKDLLPVIGDRITVRKILQEFKVGLNVTNTSVLHSIPTDWTRKWQKHLQSHRYHARLWGRPSRSNTSYRAMQTKGRFKAFYNRKNSCWFRSVRLRMAPYLQDSCPPHFLGLCESCCKIWSFWW